MKELFKRLTWQVVGMDKGGEHGDSKSGSGFWLRSPTGETGTGY